MRMWPSPVSTEWWMGILSSGVQAMGCGKEAGRKSGARLNTHFLEDMQQMGFDRRGTDIQATSDLDVGQTVADQLGDFQLTPREVERIAGRARTRRVDFSYVGREVEFDVGLDCLALLPLGTRPCLAHPEQAHSCNGAAAHTKDHFSRIAGPKRGQEAPEVASRLQRAANAGIKHRDEPDVPSHEVGRKHG